MPNKALAAWQQARHDELAAPDSWLGLIGLYWLEAGVNSVGSAADAVVNLPSGPAHFGDLRWEGGRVFWQPVGAMTVELQTDHLGKPTTVDCENWSFFVVDRDHRLAVRVRDRNWAVSRSFTGLDYFPFDRAWQIEADWQSIAPPLRLEVPNISGDLKTVDVAHRAVFAVAGQTVALLPMAVGDNEVFFVFRDRSSGKETYGAGRFLKVPAATIKTKAGPRILEAAVDPAVDGKIRLDFNRAYNPPCAFSSFATCPLPPPENWLPFPVLAGEKKWQAGD
ncbi:MAG: hypothetical protein CVU16_16375 [Betaproteobacteria bacterium HGW-Betaproteobacteria-10]|nr:MAG: hypothetical protein CVU16_16375 [Betaproteobacteria bacterium HGW-Betaproteobacteria-10]